MLNQVSPGVVTTERSYSTIIPAISTSIGALVGSFTWGPVEKITTIASETHDLVPRFGKPSNDCFEGFLAAADFLAYSDHLKVVRVVGALAKNATSGGVGSGLVLSTVTAVNGIVSSIVIKTTTRGEGYVPGDVIEIDGGITSAALRVLTINNAGGVLTAELVTGGTGYGSGTDVTTTIVSNTLIKNDEDFEDQVMLPEVVAKYPGTFGNNLMFSTVRASEFDMWRYKNRFVLPPRATIKKWSADGKTNVFALTEALKADTIVTVDGQKVIAGVDPGQYQATSTTLTFNTETEEFIASAGDNVFTLLNEHDIPTTGSVVKLEGSPVTLYSGNADVPAGEVRVRDNIVEFGVNTRRFSGDGATVTYTILGVTGITDAVVKVDGVAVTVVSSDLGTGEVLQASSGGNTTFTFFAGEQPAIGLGNVSIQWGFLAADAEVTVEYGFPPKGGDMVKTFHDQEEIHMVVADHTGDITGEEYAIMERFANLSLSETAKRFDGTSNYYVTVINRQSQYVRIASEIVVHQEKVLSGGVDDNAYGATEGVTPGILSQGYNIFLDDTVDISHVIVPGYTAEVAIHVINNIAEVRQDIVAYISPPRDTVVGNRHREVEAVLAFKDSLPSSSYYHFDSGWKYRYDIYNDKHRWVALAADSAGCYAQTADDLAPWKSGAGFNRGRIKNLVKLAWSPNKTQRDILYVNNINPVSHFTNEGAVLFGDKTGQTKSDAFDRMNVRWLFIVLRKQIAKAARYYLFENNNEFTQARFRNMVTPYLRDVKADEGMDEYRVVCDNTINTQSVKARNEFIAKILIRPQYSINFIQLDFVAVGPNVTFDEVLGQR